MRAVQCAPDHLGIGVRAFDHVDASAYGVQQTLRMAGDHPDLAGGLQHARIDVARARGDGDHEGVPVRVGECTLPQPAERHMYESTGSFRHRSKPSMDPLPDIVSLLRLHYCLVTGLDAGGDWALRFERHEGFRCNAVLEGACRLSVEGVAEPSRLEAGDCVILPQGRPFRISTWRASSRRNADEVYSPVPHGGTAVHGGGDFCMTGSRFLVSGPPADVLLGALTPMVRVRAGPHRDAVRWSLERVAASLRAGSRGHGRPAGRAFCHAHTHRLARCVYAGPSRNDAS